MNTFYLVYDCTIEEIVHMSAFAENAFETFYKMKYRAFNHTIKIFKCMVSPFFEENNCEVQFCFEEQLLDTYDPLKSYKE